MSKFFSNYPKILYAANTANPNLDLTTNITARVTFWDQLKQSGSVFYEYEIKDSDTPEIIATKYYNHPERHWIVLIFNDIIDPMFDWPMNSNNFTNYLKKKYSRIGQVTIVSGGTGYSNGFATITTTDDIGSGAQVYCEVDENGTIANTRIVSAGYNFNEAPTITMPDGTGANLISTLVANPISWTKSNIHSYYKVITTTTSTGTTVEKIEVDSITYNDDEEMGTGSNETYVLEDGSTVNVKITKETKSYFDYEIELNGSKRKIKLLKAEFVPAIEQEFIDKIQQ